MEEARARQRKIRSLHWPVCCLRSGKEISPANPERGPFRRKLYDNKMASTLLILLLHLRRQPMKTHTQVRSAAPGNEPSVY